MDNSDKNIISQRKAHWDKIYTSKDHKEVSWYQESPSISLALLKQIGVAEDDAIIDIGAGASTLVDALIEQGYEDISILDISDNALDIVKQRLADKADIPKYYTADVTEFSPARQFDVWHDRAVFHFLTQQSDKEKYVQRLSELLKPTGRAIIGTFSLNGPNQCSGLDIEQYDELMIAKLMGTQLELIDSCVDVHTTPGGATQEFMYFLLKNKK